MKDNDVIAIRLGSDKYNKSIREVYKQVSKIKGGVIYCTANMPYATIKSALKELKISGENIFFIDCITRKGTTPEPTDDCIFVDSPSSLTNISMEINNAFKKTDAEILIFDSISSLLLYSKPLTVIKFIHFLASKFRITKKKSIYIIVEGDEASEDVIRNMSMFVDLIVRL